MPPRTPGSGSPGGGPGKGGPGGQGPGKGGGRRGGGRGRPRRPTAPPRAPVKPPVETAATTAPAAQAPPVAAAPPPPAPLPPAPPAPEPELERPPAAEAVGESLLDDEPGEDLPDDYDAAPDALPPDEAFSDLFYGEEAAPPPGDWGPGLDRRKELPYTRSAANEEMRELERRIKARLSPAFPIEHRRRLPLEFVWKRVRELAMRDRSDVVDEFGRDPLYAARLRPLLDFLYDTYFRVEVSGLEHIPERGRALIVANHSGTLPYDGALLMHAVRREHAHKREVRPLVEDFVFHFPYLGTMINRIGGVRACQENAERLLNQDALVAVFPEGIKGIGKLYRERYRLQRFGRGGFIKLALRTGAPIVPCAIIGAEEIHPMVAKVTWLARSLGAPYLPITPTFPLLGPLGLLPLPTKWTIRFGPPLDYGRRYGQAGEGDRILVNKLSESVRTIIQEMLDQRLSSRKSIFFG